MVDYVGAIKKPFGDVKTLIIGIVIGIIPVISMLLNGYGAKVASKTMANDNSLPGWSFSDLTDIIVKTIMLAIIGIVYAIPAIIVGVLALGPVVLTAASGGDQGAIIASLLAGGIFMLVALLLLLIGTLLSSMGIMFYIKEGSFGAAFRIGAIIRKILTVKYWVSIIVLVIYGLVLSIVIGILSLIPVIGTIVGLGLVNFLSAVTGFSILAQVFNETP